jgi:hypothetical protein
MGLLDDAIREHLELKRRRGADPGEIARQEDEALGDPRSGEFARPEDEAGAPALLDAEPAEPPAAEPDLPAPAAEQDEPEPVPAPYDDAEPGLPEPGERARPADDSWLDEEPDEPVADAGQTTAPFTPPDVEPEEEVVRPDEEPHGDDVLGETPDFLQETPEHDRLWFEQKPPRDFDFDN